LEWMAQVDWLYALRCLVLHAFFALPWLLAWLGLWSLILTTYPSGWGSLIRAAPGTRTLLWLGLLLSPWGVGVLSHVTADFLNLGF